MDCNRVVHAKLLAYRAQVQTHETQIQTRNARIGSLETLVATLALIAQGVTDALAEIEENRTSRNGDDSHDFGAGSRRTERAARECTYSDFLKFQPLNFMELALMFSRMFLEESGEVEKYVGGLPDMIQGSVMASKPKTIQDAI
ncbi:hypothetical protein Tco_1384241 [Tanacetum coccineum]